MSVDPAHALQKAVVVALKGQTIVGDNVFDMLRKGDPYPKITVGDGQSIGNFADCYEGTESFLDIHVWSRKTGYPEAKQIADRVREVLHRAVLPLVGHTLELLDFENSRFLRDSDGVTSHVAMSFRALTQPDT